MNTELSFLLAPTLTLEVLCERYPQIWRKIQPGVCTILESCDPVAIVKHSARAIKVRRHWQDQARSGRAPGQATCHPLIAARMTELALERYFAALRSENPSRQDSLSRSLAATAQHWWWRRYLTGARNQRGAMSQRLGRWFWAATSYKLELLKAAYRQGIYCVYTDALIAGLAREIGSSPSLEIAAGDGCLTRLLRPHCNIQATDDHSWGHAITYPDFVLPLDAAAALARFRPEVVVCCWPPAGNRFEQQVFRSDAVAKYIVIGSRLEFATGDHKAYREAKDFDRETAPELARLVFPPDIEPQVHIFRRRQPAAVQPN